jgi:hypothetical protein
VTLWFMGELGSHRNTVLASLRGATATSAAGAAVPPPASGSLVVADTLAGLPSQYRPARSKSDPTSLFCKRFGTFCAQDPAFERQRLTRLCALWALTGGCSCPAASPFAHPLRVDTAALRRFVLQVKRERGDDAAGGGGEPQPAELQLQLPEGWPPLALGLRDRPLAGHPGTACGYWAGRAAAMRQSGGGGGGGARSQSQKRNAASSGGGRGSSSGGAPTPRWKRRR